MEMNNFTDIFEVTVQAPKVSTLQDPNLIIPTDFIEEYAIYFNQGRAIEALAVGGQSLLQCAAAKREWFPFVESVGSPSGDGAPVVTIRQGWRAFAAAMALAEGDILLVSLKPWSIFDFDVYLFRDIKREIDHGRLPSPPRELSPGGLPSSPEQSKESHGGLPSSPEQSKENHGGLPSSPEQLEESHGDLPSSNEQSEETATGPKEVLSYRRRDATSSRSSDPSFVVCLARCHFRALGIPQAFVRAHGELLRFEDNLVKLEGVRGGLRGRMVSCYWYHHTEKPRRQLRAPRVYLAGCPSGWSDFMRENGLEVGQTLKFTLTANSIFVVEEIPEPCALNRSTSL